MLDCIAAVLAHFGREIEAVALFEKVAYAALTRLRVYANDVALVVASEIFRVDRKIRHVPMRGLFGLAPLKALGDSVLVRARERGKYELARIRLAGRDGHCRQFLVYGDGFGYV